ncbi:hypothetical protein [Streptomyces sp. NPDC006274]|uniref:hypothetical protein n=1 Tax=unclassified Streptomyces TaxID=2593676 RepID=UPI0033AF1818
MTRLSEFRRVPPVRQHPRDRGVEFTYDVACLVSPGREIEGLRDGLEEDVAFLDDAGGGHEGAGVGLFTGLA